MRICKNQKRRALEIILVRDLDQARMPVPAMPTCSVQIM